MRVYIQQQSGMLSEGWALEKDTEDIDCQGHLNSDVAGAVCYSFLLHNSKAPP